MSETVKKIIRIKEIDEILKSNSSSMFLLKPLNLSEKDLKTMGFMDSYLRDVDNPTAIDHPVFLLFKPEQFEKLEAFIREQYERKDECLLEDYDYEGGYTILMYSIPDEWTNDYNLFMYGKYSQFSKKFTELFSKRIIITGAGEQKSIPYMIITKDANWIMTLNDLWGTELTERDELWKIPNLDKETLNITEIRNKEQKKEEE